MIKNRIILIIIFVVAAFLRFFQLGINPPSLTWDEVSWGYNAYSIGIDARDEFGRFLPFDYLESFGDFKPPMYAYMSVVPVKIFGLNEFAVRFTSALFGTLSILVSYFLVKVLFVNRKTTQSYTPNHAEIIALLASLLLAISPWHIMLSRAAFEANVATFFIIFGVWTFISGAQKKPSLLILSAISFCLSIYTFNSARIVAPLLVLLLTIGFYKKLLKIKKTVVIAGIVGMCMILPISKFLLSPQASLRFKEVNIFSDIEIIKSANQEIANDGNTLWSKAIHNRRVAYTKEYLKHYFDHFSPNFLFIRGDVNPKFSIQDAGQMYLWELPFFIGGIILLIKKREGHWWIVPFWLLLAIIPAATARETPHALRIENSLPTFQIFTAYGAGGFLLWLNGKKEIWNKYRKAVKLGWGLLLFLNVLYFLNQYFTHYPIEQSREWQYGYKESIKFVSDNEKNYANVYITDELGRPYIYYLFYQKTSPVVFRKEAVVERDAFGFVNVKEVGKNKFFIESDKTPEEKSLYIDISSKVPQNAKVLEKFRALDGSDVLTAYEL